MINSINNMLNQIEDELDIAIDGYKQGKSVDLTHIEKTILEAVKAINNLPDDSRASFYGKMQSLSEKMMVINKSIKEEVKKLQDNLKQSLKLKTADEIYSKMNKLNS
jgi:hypothetical protein